MLLSDVFISLPLCEPVVEIADQVANGFLADADKLRRGFATKLPSILALSLSPKVATTAFCSGQVKLGTKI